MWCGGLDERTSKEEIEAEVRTRLIATRRARILLTRRCMAPRALFRPASALGGRCGGHGRGRRPGKAPASPPSR